MSPVRARADIRSTRSCSPRTLHASKPASRSSTGAWLPKKPEGRKHPPMTFIINNHDVEQVLTMEDTLAALEKSYLDLAAKEAVCRPRIDIRIPTSDPARNYQWGTMEGGSTGGYFAIPVKSDVVYETPYGGGLTPEKKYPPPGLVFRV